MLVVSSTNTATSDNEEVPSDTINERRNILESYDEHQLQSYYQGLGTWCSLAL